MDSNMIRRVSFAVIAIPLLFGAVWWGAWPLVAVLMLAALLGTNELFKIAVHTGVKPFGAVGRTVATLIPPLMLLALAENWLASKWLYLGLLVTLVVVGTAVFARAPDQRPLAAIAVTLFAPVYTAVLPSMAFLIRHAQWGERSWTGTALVFFPLVVTWVCDSAAMFGGRLIGGAKMAPTISPGKTWAGGIAGVVGGVAVGGLYAVLLFPRLDIRIDIFAAIVLALVISIVGQIGDLAESLMKREAGVKDSSALIPGHGGVLDRLDSLYFAIPVAAFGYHLLGLM
jgi:phosphatidate cytidylyltransferase